MPDTKDVTPTDGSPAISRRAVFWLIVIACVAGAVVTIVGLSRGEQTPNEALLLSLLLTLLSVSAGWLITHTFYQDDRRQQIAAIKLEYDNNLRTYAVKASEKLINLSNQIARLTSFIEAENYSSVSDEQQAYRLLCERQRAAVHMLETLRSMNDTSLSDWEGVIGDRLDAKRYLDEQRNYDINEMLETIRQAAKTEVNSVAVSKTDFDGLLKELKNLTLSESSLPASRRALSVALPCPSCGREVRLRTNSKGLVRKTAATCPTCKVQLAVTGGRTDKPALVKRERKKELVKCSGCGTPGLVELDNAAPSQATLQCDNCGFLSVAIRNADGISIKGPVDPGDPKPRPISPSLVEQVFTMLPAQPWPTGIHHEIARKLNTSASQVGKAVRLLIKDGRVKDQINGIVVDTSAEADSSSLN